MSDKDLSNTPVSGGQSLTLQAMQKPSAPMPQSKPVSPIAPQQKTSEMGPPSLTYVLIGAVGLLMAGGLLYIGYELTKPTKKSRPNKTTHVTDKEKHTAKQERKINKPLKNPDQEAGERHNVLLER